MLDPSGQLLCACGARLLRVRDALVRPRAPRPARLAAVRSAAGSRWSSRAGRSPRIGGSGGSARRVEPAFGMTSARLLRLAVLC